MVLFFYMKKTPTVQIRELKKQIKDIATVLSCKPIISDIMAAIFEAQGWRTDYVDTKIENDKLRVNMGKTIDEQVQKFTFNVGLENQKLKLEVDRLNKIINTKDNETKIYKEKATINKKGFWDFMYKVCKLV